MNVPEPGSRLPADVPVPLLYRQEKAPQAFRVWLREEAAAAADGAARAAAAAARAAGGGGCSARRPAPAGRLPAVAVPKAA